jgi:hypothetical protein
MTDTGLGSISDLFRISKLLSLSKRLKRQSLFNSHRQSRWITSDLGIHEAIESCSFPERYNAPCLSFRQYLYEAAVNVQGV